jgi:hypothetical protein
MTVASDAFPALTVPADESSVGRPASAPLIRFLWDGWKAYSRRAARYQSTFLLSLVYYLVLGPTSLVVRLFGVRLLDLDVSPRQSYWRPRPLIPVTLDSLRRQY